MAQTEIEHLTHENAVYAMHEVVPCIAQVHESTPASDRWIKCHCRIK